MPFSTTAFTTQAAGDLAITDVTMSEGNAGTTNFTFTVTRTNGAGGAVGATWTLTLSGTANAADFSPSSQTGTVSFAAGDSTSQTITITVAGDLVYEPNETFTVVLSAPTGGATLADATGAGSINNDDAPVPPSVDLNGADPGTNFTAGSFTEGGAAASIGNGIIVTQGSLPITGATITITDAIAGDALSLSGALPGTITVLSNTGTVLTLTGTGTASDWESALALVRYANSSDNPDVYGTDTARTINVTVTDGVAPGPTAVATIAIAADNDAPVVTNFNGDSVSYTEGAAYVLLDLGGNATVTDADNQNFAGGNLSFGSFSTPLAEDHIGVQAVGNVTLVGSDVRVSGISIGTIAVPGVGEMLRIDLNGNATPAAVQELLRAIGYTNSAGGSPTAGLRNFTWILNDGAGDGTGGGVDVTVATVPSGPDVDLNGPDAAGTSYFTGYTENDNAGVAIGDFDLTVIDDGGEVASVSIAIADGRAGDELFSDVPLFFLGFTGGWNAGTFTFTITAGSGTDFDENFANALTHIRFRHNGDDPTFGGSDQTRLITVTANDGTLDGPVAQTGITITALPDPPVIDLDGPGGTVNYAAAYTENGTGVAVTDSDVSVVSIEGGLTEIFATLTDIQAGDVFFIALNPSVHEDISYQVISASVIRVYHTGSATAADLAHALTFLRFRSTSEDPTIGGADTQRTINFSATDNGGSGNAITTITITATNDAAVIGGTDTGSVTEDGTTTAGGTLTASDPDGTNGFQSADLVGTYGGFELQTNGSWSYSLFNAAANVQALGAGQQVTDTFTIHSTDGTAHDVVVTVNGTNDAPVNTVPGTQFINEDTTRTFSAGNGNAISVADADIGGGTLYIELTCSNGILTLSGTAGLTFTVGANGSAGMYFNGTAAAINAALNGLTFTPAANYHGAAAINLVTYDGPVGGGGTLFDSDTINLTIASVNDAPTGTSNTVTTNEDVAYVLTFADFGYSDVDGDAMSGLYIVTGVITGGTLLLNGTPLDGNSNFVTKAQIDAGQLVFVPTPNGNGAGFGDFGFQVVDSNGALDPNLPYRHITIDVTAVNDAPVNTVPGTQFINEDTTRTFSAGNGNAISVADADIGGGTLYIELTCSNGILTLSGTAGLTFTVGANGSAGMYFNGTAAAINAALNGLTFTPAANYHGAAAINLVTYDGPVGGGGTLFDSDTINLTIASVNDNPEGTSTTVTTPEDTAYVLTYADFGYSDVDGDAMAGLYIVTGAPTGGTLYLNGNALDGNSNFVTTAQINAGQLVFVPTANGNGAGFGDFGFQVVDNNGALDVTLPYSRITVDVTAVNDAPTLTGTGANPTYIEGGPHAILFTDVTPSTFEAGQDFTSLTLTITNVTDAGEVLDVGVASFLLVDGNGGLTAENWVVTIDVTGTLATVTITHNSGSFTAAQAEALIEGLAYRHTGDNPTDADRVVTITQLADSGSNVPPNQNTAMPNLQSAVDVVPVNDAPESLANDVDAPFDGVYTFKVADFPFTDAENDGLLEVTITSLPTLGTIYYNGVAISAGDDFSPSDIALGLLTYEPVSGASAGDGYATFGYVIRDDGGILNGGQDTDQTPATITIDLVDNQPPVVDHEIPDQNINEDNPFNFQFAADAFSDPDMDSLTYTATLANGDPLPGTLAFDGNTRTFSGAPPLDYAGTLVIRVTASDGQVSVYDDFNLVVAPVNDAPVLDFNDSVTFVEDNPGNPGLSPIHLDLGADSGVSDVDSANFDGGTLTLTITSGGVPAQDILTVQADAHVTVSGSDILVDSVIIGSFAGGTGGTPYVVTFNASATPPAVTFLLRALVYDNNSQEPTSGDRFYSLVITDGDGGTSNSGAGHVSVFATNDPPTGTDNTVSTAEDTAYIFTLADFGFSDVDGDQMTGVFIHTNGSSSGLVYHNGTPLTGTSHFVSTADINAGLLSFLPALNANGDDYATFAFQVQDNGGTDNGSGAPNNGDPLDQIQRTMTIDVTAANDGPSLDFNDSVTFVEDNPGNPGLSPIHLDLGADSGVSDVDSANFDGGTLTLTITSGGVPAQDILTVQADAHVTVSGSDILVDSVIIGSFAGGTGGTPYVVTFNASATPAAVSLLLRALVYDNNSQEPTQAPRFYSLVITDGDGGTSNTGSGRIDVFATNDPPTGANNTVTFNEDTTYTFTVADFGFSDVDGDQMTGVFIHTNGSSSGLITHNGVPVTGTSHFVTTADINAGLLRFVPPANANGDDYATFTFQVQDNGGTDNGSGAPNNGDPLDQIQRTMTIDITAVNDRPTINLLSNNTAQFTEGGAPALLDLGSNATVTDIDSADFDGGSLTVAITGGYVPSEDVLGMNGAGVVSLSNGTNVGSQISIAGTVFGTVTASSNNSISISFDSDATPARVQELLRIFNYSNTNALNPSTTLRSITWTLVDGDGVANGGTDTRTINSFVVVSGVNDAPSGTDATIVLNEDTNRTLTTADFGFSDVDGNGFLAVFVNAPTAGTLLLNGTPITSSTFILASDIADGDLVFVPALNANGDDYASFTFQVVDNGGSSSGQDTDQSPNTITFDVTAVNDAPVNNVPGAQTINEDGTLTFSGGTLISVNDVDANGEDVTVTVSVLHGTLAVGGNAGLTSLTGDGTAAVVIVGSVAEVNNALNGLLYTPTLNYNGPDTLQVDVSDNGNSGTGGALAASSTVGITVNPVNDAPQGTDTSRTINEDGTLGFTAADFGFSDPVESHGFLAVIITTLPANGTLTLSGNPVLAGAEISVANIPNLLFTPLPNANGAGYGNFTFQVRDNGGGANGGVDTDQSANSFTINVTAVNDAPQNSVPGAQSVNEDGSLTLSAAFGNRIQITDIDAGSGTVSVTLSVAHGILTVAVVANVGYVDNGTASVTISGTVADINNALSTALVYNPAPDYFGPDSISVLTSDGGNTGTGGPLTDSDSVAITVNPVNDVPVLAVTNTASYIENAAPVVINPNLTLTDVDDTNLVSGTVGISGNWAGSQDVLAFVNDNATLYGNISGSYNPGSGLLTLTSAGGTATLAQWQAALRAVTYTNTSDAPSTSPRGIDFTVNDGDGNSNVLFSQVNVTAQNDAPVLDNSASPALPGVNEDAGAPTGATPGYAVSFIANLVQVPAGLDNVSDPDPGAQVGIAITAVNPNGTLYYSTDSGATWTAVPAVSATAAFLLGPNDQLYFQPAANYNGTITDVLTFRAWDQTSGTHLGFGDTTVNGGTTAFSTATDTVSLSVTAVNDAPTVVNGGTASAATTNEDTPGAGQTVSTLFGSHYSDAADAQFSVSNPGGSSPGSFSGVAVVANGSSGATGQWEYFDTNSMTWVAVGSVSASNALLIGGGTAIRFNPAADYNGTAPTLTVHLIDNSLGFGITFGQHVDISAMGATGGTTAYSTGQVVLNQDVAAVNDAPVNTVPGGQSVDEDVSVTLSSGNGNAISVADIDASILSVTLSVAHGTLSLASTLGLTFTSGDGTSDATMTFSGTAAAINAALGAGLTYVPTANYNGADAISVVTSDGGQTGSGGTLQDSDSIAITVNSIHDAPQGTDNTVTGSEDDPYVFTLADFGFSDPNDTPPDDFATVVLANFPTNGILYYDPDGPGGVAPINLANNGPTTTVPAAHIALGRLYFVPDADTYGDNYASFQFLVGDNGANGLHVDQTVRTMTIDITPDNVAPIVDLDSGTAGVDYTTTFVEDSAAVPISFGISVIEPDENAGDRIESATVTLTDARVGDSLTVGAMPLGFNAVVNSSASTVTLTITGTGTAAQYQSILATVGFITTGQDPTFGGTDPTRTITVTVNDGALSSAVATATINITPVDDAPAPGADTFTIEEDGTITGGNLFANDSDPDGPPGFQVIEVNGSAANVGAEISLVSGAILTVNADGTFDYNPNGAFLPTPTAGSGASNTPGQDSFTYTLTGGNMATVTILLTGEDTDDTLLGTAGADILSGGNGDDTYYVENGADQVLEANGQGYDRVIASVSYALAAGSSVEILEAVAGSAAINLTGNELVNTILGNAGNNVLQGGMGADILEGNDGNDVIYGEGGIDTARGGAGDDVYIVDASTDIVEEAYGGGNDTVLTQVSYRLTSGADVELLSTTFHAGTANLELTGNFGNQTIIGNAGANVITGGVGADVLIGLAGNDTYIVHDNRAVVVEDAGQGSDTVFTSVSYALAAGSSVEVLSTSFHGGTGAINLTGNALAQTIYGNNGGNIIQGGGGADVLIGLGGDDLYRVDATNAHVYEALSGGNDQVYTSVSFTLDADQEIEFFATTDFAGTDAINLTGNNLNNTIYANAGSNVLDGKGGNDALVGLEGADTYQFTTALGAGNVDTIFGFAHGVDKIALDDAVFTAIGPLGALNANAFVVGTAAGDADDRIIYNSATGQLFYDADGNGAGAQVLFATLNGGGLVTASDFTVI